MSEPAATAVQFDAAEIRVQAGEAVTFRVRGPAVVRVDAPGPGGPPADGWEAITAAAAAEAVALLTACRHGIGNPGLSGDVPPADVTTALAVLAAVLLKHMLPGDQGAKFLADLGAYAATAGGPRP